LNSFLNIRLHGYAAIKRAQIFRQRPKNRPNPAGLDVELGLFTRQARIRSKWVAKWSPVALRKISQSNQFVRCVTMCVESQLHQRAGD